MVDRPGRLVPVSLNIKNPRVHELARLAARRTGLTQTSAIERALEELLAQLDEPPRADRRERVDEILADVHARLSEAQRSALTTDALYDERGLPA